MTTGRGWSRRYCKGTLKGQCLTIVAGGWALESLLKIYDVNHGRW